MLKIEELFDDWVEFDVAQYYLACLLSLTTYDPSGGFARMKGPFSWKSEFGTMCYEILEKMVSADLLERNEVRGYRWNKSFDAYWLRDELRPSAEE